MGRKKKEAGDRTFTRLSVEPVTTIRFRNAQEGEPAHVLNPPITLEQIRDRFQLEGYESAADAALDIVADLALSRASKTFGWTKDTSEEKMSKDLSSWTPVLRKVDAKVVLLSKVWKTLEAEGQTPNRALVSIVAKMQSKAEGGKPIVDDLPSDAE